MGKDKWFEVSAKGLKELQDGKPRSFVARELIQNAWDEAVDEVRFEAHWDSGAVQLVVEDDSPEGFRDLADAFTLFAPTYKRANPEKRGRFNLGEKQVLAVSDQAVIRTTKGTLVFDRRGRHSSTFKTERGSEVTIFLRMSKAQYEEMLYEVRSYITPPGLAFYVNGDRVGNREPVTAVEATLPTEVLLSERLVRTNRKTDVRVHEANGPARLYEMGIPVCEIDCAYDLDVQQKVPLSADRETVPQSFLRALYAEVLNVTHERLTPETSSATWVRQATESERVSSVAVKAVIENRYGKKVVVANPFDRISIDDAVAAGYRVVYGSEMSGAEWENTKKAGVMPSSSDVFGHGAVAGTPVEPDANMKAVAELTRRIGRRCLSIEVEVVFSSWAGVAAQYGDRTLIFNVKTLGVGFFSPPLSQRVLDLIIHELAHEKGLHTERSYLNTLSSMAGRLIMLALAEPEFFEVEA